MVDNFIANFI
jgi:hypothetical protein